MEQPLEQTTILFPLAQSGFSGAKRRKREEKKGAKKTATTAFLAEE